LEEHEARHLLSVSDAHNRRDDLGQLPCLRVAEHCEMNHSEREAAARVLAAELPTGYVFQGVVPFSLGDHQHEIAMFDFEGVTFALIPGGQVRLGYDSNRNWEPTPEERESFMSMAEAYGITHSLGEHLSTKTSSPRNVEFRPFLLESVAGGVGWEPIAADDPEVREIVSTLTTLGRGIGRVCQRVA
jgi:hypothetical protein